MCLSRATCLPFSAMVWKKHLLSLFYQVYIRSLHDIAEEMLTWL
jgi:hypothetical protein